MVHSGNQKTVFFLSAERKQEAGKKGTYKARRQKPWFLSRQRAFELTVTWQHERKGAVSGSKGQTGLVPSFVRRTSESSPEKYLGITTGILVCSLIVDHLTRQANVGARRKQRDHLSQCNATQKLRVMHRAVTWTKRAHSHFS